jgi:hypothetical protein
MARLKKLSGPFIMVIPTYGDGLIIAKHIS